jgi:hypothetical protein
MVIPEKHAPFMSTVDRGGLTAEDTPGNTFYNLYFHPII